jgi:threonyl-tRNA synthetase
MPRITLPDGTVKQFDLPVTAAQVAREIGEGLAKAAIGAKVNGTLWDVNRPITSDAELAIVTRPRPDKQGISKFRDEQHQKDALYFLRHSCAHVMAEAIERLWPDTKLAYGPPLDNGFYYDISLDTPISSTDFSRIEAEMKKIVEENRPFTRYEMEPVKGMVKLKDEANKYKIDNAERAITGGAATLSWYVTGPLTAAQETGTPPYWEDLCMGPHVPSTGELAAFKIMSIASSNWHGDVESDRFQRVYGTAFFTAADLTHYLTMLEEAKQRDHRVIGQKLGLFAIDDKVGQGLVLWKPKGAIIRDQLQQFISAHLQRQGYSQVFTPHIGKLDLYRTSGHFPYYADSQFPPMIDRETIKKLADEGCTCGDLASRMEAGDIDGYMLKPMNCPHHIRIYASEKHSYRDLPIRLAEFGTVYRWEQSGELGGMTRVRAFTQDDAHLFVTEEQLDAEVNGCLELVKIVFATLGMADYRVRVGLRDPDSEKYVGKPEQWDKAEAACKKAAASLGVPFSVEPGEAAFYGPKIDFVVKDVIGREWQLGTVQVDYQLPNRFDLTYIGADNAEHRPVMIHRAPFGSMERFIGVLIEHFAGAFPLWLSPEQVRVLPISDKFAEYANKVTAALKDVGLRVSMDDSNDRVNGKIKAAQEEKVPYMLVVGGRDAEGGTVSVRERTAGDLGAMPLEQFVAQAREEVASRGKTRVKV